MRNEGPVEIVDHAANKIAFLSDVLVTGLEEISEEGKNGLGFILWDIQDELKEASRKVHAMKLAKTPFPGERKEGGLTVTGRERPATGKEAV